jgi:hypothetical protein
MTRHFRCYDCNHEWQLPHGKGGPGSSLACPECESQNVHRAPTDRGWARRGQAQADGEDAAVAQPGYGRGRGWGRGRGRGFGGHWRRP